MGMIVDLIEKGGNDKKEGKRDGMKREYIVN